MIIFFLFFFLNYIFFLILVLLIESFGVFLYFLWFRVNNFCLGVFGVWWGMFCKNVLGFVLGCSFGCLIEFLGVCCFFLGVVCGECVDKLWWGYGRGRGRGWLLVKKWLSVIDVLLVEWMEWMEWRVVDEFFLVRVEWRVERDDLWGIIWFFEIGIGIGCGIEERLGGNCKGNLYLL